MNRPYTVIALILFMTMLTAPLLGVQSERAATAAAGVESEVVRNDAAEVPTDGGVRLYMSGEKSVVTLSVREYLTGVVAAEMPASYEPQALQAQAIAAKSVYLVRKEQNAGKDYDITDDSTKDQSYLDEDARQEKWGSSFAENEKRIADAVESAKGGVLSYDGKTAFAAYHAISGGRTESAENIWGGSYPYLKAVESVSDMLAQDYISTVTYTRAEFAAGLKGLGISITDDASVEIGKSSSTDSGTVKSIPICGKALTGEQLRSAFELRSANFDLSAKEDKFVFTVRGYGHGVGMSQFGANFMAKQGSSCEEILVWYYSGCEIVYA